MKETNKIMYNIWAYNFHSMKLQDEYEQLIEFIKRHMREIEYDCRIDFNAAEYLLSADCETKHKPVEYPVIHIIAEPATDQIKRLIDNAIQQNIEFHYVDNFENGKLELTEDDLSNLAAHALREDKIELQILKPDKFLDITRHEFYGI